MHFCCDSTVRVLTQTVTLQALWAEEEVPLIWPSAASLQDLSRASYASLSRYAASMLFVVCQKLAAVAARLGTCTPHVRCTGPPVQHGHLCTGWGSSQGCGR